MNALLPRAVIPDLIRDPCSKTTAVRAELVEACTSLNVGGTSDKPGLAPAGDSLSLASPRESKQREGDPMVWVPSLRCGQPAVLAESGVELELGYRLRQSLALIRFRLRSSAQPDGWGKEYGFGEARTRRARPRRGPIANPNLNSIPIPPPFWLRRGAEGQTDKDGRLSERSEFEPGPGWTEHRRLPRSVAQGSQTVGSPFLLLTFLLATQKKSELPPGNPRLVGTPPTQEGKTASTGSARMVEAPRAKRQTASDATETKR